MKSNYGAADWSLYAWKRSSSSEREKSSHNLLHEVFILQEKQTCCEMIWPRGHSSGRIPGKLCSGSDQTFVLLTVTSSVMVLQSLFSPGGSIS